MQVEKISARETSQYLAWDDFGSRIIGRATVVRSGDSALVQHIDISREYRGNGAGSELLKIILSDLEGLEVKTTTFEGRVKWYEKHGFRRTGERNKLVEMKKSP